MSKKDNLELQLLNVERKRETLDLTISYLKSRLSQYEQEESSVHKEERHDPK